MSSSFVNRRREEIVALLVENGSVSVAELAERFSVSSLTIRRDLDHLEKEGVLERSYGVARLVSSHNPNSPYEREHAKRAIAALAATLIDDGDIVFVNTGTTAMGILEFVNAQGVTFVTNNGRALEAKLPASSTVILTGGEIRVPKWSMTGDFALSNIAQIKADKCFLNCSGFSAARGLTTNVAQEMRINALMLENSRMHVVVAESAKIDSDASFSYGEADQVDVLVTDSFVSAEQVERLLAAGVHDIQIAQV